MTTTEFHPQILDEPSLTTTVLQERAAVQPKRFRHEDEIDLLNVLIVLARRKRMILGITLATAAIAIIVSLLLPNRYTATTRILPPQQSQSASTILLNQLSGGMGPLAALAGSSLGLKNPSDIYIGVLKSRTIQDDLIQRFDLMRVYHDKHPSDARKDLAGYSDILAEKEGLISISVEDKDPKRAAAMANAYVDELRNLTQHLAIGEASQRRLFFERQVKQAKEDLSDAEVTLKETQQNTGMIQLDSQAKAVIEAIGNLRAQIAAKEVQLHAMRSFATDQNPQYVLSEQQLSGLRTQLVKLESQTGGGDGDPILATSKVPGVALEYVRKHRDVKYYETIFELLAKQYEAAKIDEAREAAVIQVVDGAVEPDKRSWPKPLMFTVAGIVLGVLVGSAWSLYSEAVSGMNDNDCIRQQLLQLHSSLGFKKQRFQITRIAR